MTRTAVEVKNLGFAYEDGRVALRDVSLAIAEGETVGLIGPNGAGKSTLLLHLNGILPEDGRGGTSVWIHGLPVIKPNLPDIRRDVGLLFQDPEDQLFCPTVFEDIAFGPRQFGSGEGDVEGIVREALAKVGLSGFERRSPHHLSSGEKQRVCLAGLLACRPRVLALDEPTRGLDPRGKRLLKTLLRTIEATKIIATHDLELVAELCTRAVVMDEGTVVADGPALSILSDEDLMLKHGLEKPHILRHSHPH
ncbi:MAG: ABC transporter ATP-binding protein [Candidatus Aminicenantales bacterium]